MENQKKCCEEKDAAEISNDRKSLFWLLVGAAVLLGLFAFFRYSPAGANLLWQISNGGKWLLPMVIVSSLIDSINPCAFSVLLVTIAFLLSLNKDRKKIMQIGGAYIFGIFAVYILIGLGLLQALHLFNTPHFMAKVGASVLVILGLIDLIGHYFPSFPIKLVIPSFAKGRIAGLMAKASIPTAILLGALVGLCEFPCTGGPYLMILGLLHDQTVYWSGAGYLFLYNLIFIAPLVVILFIASEKSLLGKVQEWRKKEIGNAHLISGVLMIVLGVLIFVL